MERRVCKGSSCSSSAAGRIRPSVHPGSGRLEFSPWWWGAASNKSMRVLWGGCCFLGKVLECLVNLSARIWSWQQLLTLCWGGASCSSKSEQNYQYLELGEPHVVISWLDRNHCQKTAFNWIVAFLFNDTQKKGNEEEVNRWARSCFPSPFQLPAGAGILF